MGLPLIKRVSWLVLGVLLGACAGPGQVPSSVPGMPVDKLPPVSLFFQHPEREFRQDCEAYDMRSPLHDCRINSIDLRKVRQAFAAAGTFSHTSYANNEVDYQILFTTALYDNESGRELGNAVLSGATLMLVPLKRSREITVRAVLTWQGVTIDEFFYRIPFETQLSLLKLKSDVDAKLADLIASKLLQDLQQRDSFSSTLLSKKLHSSNYAADLTIPQVNNDFIFYDQHIFHHPLLGIQIRYQHRHFFFDFIDVFVYPVKHWNLKSRSENLLKEVENVRKEIEAQQSRGAFRNLTLNETRVYRHGGFESGSEILHFDGEFTNRRGERYASRTYLFIKQDKFVKVRASFAKTSESLPDTDRFVDTLFESTRIPAESSFMMKVRDNWRGGKTKS